MIKFNLVYIASNNYRIITRRIHGTAVSASFQFRKERYYGTNINYDGNAFNVISAYLYSQGNVDSANKDTVRVTRNYESSSFRLHRLMVIDQWNLLVRWTIVNQNLEFGQITVRYFKSSSRVSSKEF